MSKSLEIVIDEDGNMSIEGFGLVPGEEVKDVAKDFTNALGKVTDIGHKHTHTETEVNREFA